MDLLDLMIIVFKTLNLPYPISGFSHVYDDWEQLVIAAQHELDKEGDFIPVFTFCFHLIREFGLIKSF